MENVSFLYSIIATVFAILITYTATPLVRVLAYKIGAIDVPRDDRRMHKEPIPRLGGLAIFLSFTITTIIFCNYNPTLLVMWFGGLIIMVGGILDDVFSIHPLIKLAIQIFVAVLAVLQGVRIEFINVFGTYITFGYFSIPITILWIVLLTNSINIIDGLDGLACGVSAICSLSLLVIAVIAEEYEFALIMAIIVGACVGFLPFNSNPAKIFMGDTGSLFLGYILSVYSVQSLFKLHTVIAFVIPLATFALPVMDIGFAFFRRIIHGKNPFMGDKNHIHHKLIQMGFNQKQSVLILYSVCGMFGTASVMVALGKLTSALIIIGAGSMIFLLNYIIVKKPKLREYLGLDLEKKDGK